jgi:hypothetical protein
MGGRGRAASGQPKKVNDNQFTGLSVEKTIDDRVDDNTSEVKSLSEQVKKLCSLLESQEKRSHEQWTEHLKVIEGMQSEIGSLKTKNAELVEIIKKLKTEQEEEADQTDALQQRDRRSNARMYNVKIDKDEEKRYGHNTATCMAAYRAITPVLEHSDVKDRIGHPVNNWYNVFVSGHKLFAPKDSQTVPPIIVRFKTRNLKSLILANRDKLNVGDVTQRKEGERGEKEKEEEDKGENKGQKRKQGVFVTQDLTKRRYTLLCEYIQSNLFKKVWLLDGEVLKFIVKNDPMSTVHTTKISKKSPRELINDIK